MRGMKLLISRYARHKIVLLISLLLMVGVLTAVMVFHADMGAESTEPGDYMMCKIIALFPMILCADLPVIFMTQETQGSRFMRATPCAERMYRTDIPLFSTLNTFAWTVLTIFVYSAFILITGRDISNISDIIVPAAVIGFIFSIVMCCTLTMRYGAVAYVIYYLPFILVMDFFGVADNGFGVPLWLAVALLFAAFGAGFVVDLIISRVAYAKCNFREATYNVSKPG